jgi:hypothetical protein
MLLLPGQQHDMNINHLVASKAMRGELIEASSKQLLTSPAQNCALRSTAMRWRNAANWLRRTHAYLVSGFALFLL